MKKLLLNVLVFGITSTSLAYHDFANHGQENVGGGNGNMTKAASCAPSNERLFMEFNNVRALVETAGFLWMDRANSNASYEVPSGSNKFAIFAGALWMGGEDVNGQLKLAGHKFREGNDFWAGPLGDLIAGSGNYDPFVVQNADVTLYKENGAAEIQPSECLKWDNFFTIRKQEVVQFINWWKCENGELTPDECTEITKPDDEVMNRIENWPAHGDVGLGQDFYLAPFYDNAPEGQQPNGFYDPLVSGDYPWYDIEDEVDCRNDRRVTLFGDETHWWVFNDKGNIHTESGGDPIGMEVRAQAFAFATDDAINDMTFYNYELINRGTQTLFNTYFGQYVDPDIGFAANDFVGCDVSRGLGFCFNGESTDDGQGGQDPYGANPPAIGVDFFEGPYKDNDFKDNPLDTNVQFALAEDGIPYAGLGLGYGDGVVDNERIGMARFVYYNNSGGFQGDPNSATEFYNYMTGFWKNNAPIVYGGTGISGSILTNYCFPGDSDPYNWGTAGIDPGPLWSEVAENNPPGDRRFFQAAGPFTLLPGAVNNITVGVVYGRNTAESDLEASVRTMKTADSKAQALFDACFELVEPPPAPLMTIQEMENELIIYLEEPPGFNEQTWFEEDVINIVTPDDLIQQGIYYDDTFRFEGYQIYQMANSEATVSDLDDIEKARIVAQCDIENGVGKLVNYTFDEQIGASVPTVKVDGADAGLSHSFSIKEDQFATGARNLVNHKKYYYIAVAYAYNNYLTYDPNDPGALDGQKQPYLRSRLSGTGGNIEAVIGIPHDPTPEADGTQFTTSYGFQPKITQIEGTGNGGNFLQLDSLTRIQTVMNAPYTINHPIYESGGGPVDIKVVDPLNLQGGTYTLGFGQDSSSIDEDTWWLERVDGAEIDTAWSDYVIGTRNEQLLLDWGISVTVNQQFYTGPGGETSKFTEPIGATMTFADSSKAWLTGIPDDDNFYPTNWIRSGTTDENETDNAAGCDPNNWIYNQCSYNDKALDPESMYEQLLGGTVAPFNRVGSENYGMPVGFPGDDPNNNTYTGDFSTLWQAQTKSSFVQLHDVDIIITSDQNLWTRCPVIEINNNESQTEYGDDVMEMRSDNSVGKDGLPDASGTTGMGWFPGYAVDVNTGSRLNMAFGENSWLLGENGADMIWNPTSNITDQTFNPLFGGMHYIYVFGENVDNSGCPAYDEGSWLATEFAQQSNSAYRDSWKNCMWVMNPVLIQDRTLLETDVEINLRIKKPYEERNVLGENNGRPMYMFTIDNPTETLQADDLESVLDNINIVPNPYYGYSSYETNKLDNRVKIVNLPERCTVTIFNMQGALVRTFEKDDALTSIDWDLKNHKNVPIAGGMYIIHIKMPIIGTNATEGEQERIIKWYGALRQPDLENL